MNQADRAVDASVAVKWVVTTEVHAAQAAALLADSLAAGRPLIGPPYLHGEVANALYQRARSHAPARRLASDEADRSLRMYFTIPIVLLSPPGLYEQAFAIASQYQLPSLYDAMYVTLAQRTGIELWTADQRLLTALGSEAPWVRDLSTYPLPKQLA